LTCFQGDRPLRISGNTPRPTIEQTQDQEKGSAVDQANAAAQATAQKGSTGSGNSSQWEPQSDADFKNPQNNTRNQSSSRGSFSDIKITEDGVTYHAEEDVNHIEVTADGTNITTNKNDTGNKVDVIGDNNSVIGDGIIDFEGDDNHFDGRFNVGSTVTFKGDQNRIYGSLDNRSAFVAESGENNTMYGGSKRDTVRLWDNTSNNTVFGGNEENGGRGDDISSSGVKNKIYSEGGNDNITIFSGAVDNFVDAGEGNDNVTLHGNHRIEGDAGDDNFYSFDSTGARIDGGDDYDTLYVDIPYSDDVTFVPDVENPGSYTVSDGKGSEWSIKNVEEVRFTNPDRNNDKYAVLDQNGEWQIVTIIHEDTGIDPTTF